MSSLDNCFQHLSLIDFAVDVYRKSGAVDLNEESADSLRVGLGIVKGCQRYPVFSVKFREIALPIKVYILAYRKDTTVFSFMSNGDSVIGIAVRAIEVVNK